MIATTYCRRPLWVKLARPFAIWWLRREIHSAEVYVEHTRKGGVFNAQQLADLERNIGPLRVRLAMWRNA